ncbi:MAG: glycosyltransferase [archaeon]|nr:glycosyltransferase [archaeon]
MKTKSLAFILLVIVLFNLCSSTYVKFDEAKEKIAIQYLQFCKKGGLLPGSLEKVKHPKISVVIPMYNEAKHFTLALRSIQNQSLREIEIICMDDCSTDNSQELLEKMKEEDPRIRIIRNKKNRGVLYNRIYGALKAKGEYIAFVDADDAYVHMNVFKNLYEQAKKLDFPETIHFHSCGGNYDGDLKFDNLYLFFIYNPTAFGKIFYQPEIRDNYMQKRKHITGSGLVFDKIYSKALIKRMADFIGEDLWNQHLVYIDDYLVAFATMRVTQSFVTVDEIGYWHWFDNGLSMTTSVYEIEGDRLKNPKKSNKKILDYILIKERMFDLTEDDPNSEEFRTGALRDLEKEDYMKGIARSIHFDRLMAIYERFINWKYITEQTKKDTIIGLEKFLSYAVPVRNKYKNYLSQIEDLDL